MSCAVRGGINSRGRGGHWVAICAGDTIIFWVVESSTCTPITPHHDAYNYDHNDLLWLAHVRYWSERLNKIVFPTQMTQIIHIKKSRKATRSPLNKIVFRTPDDLDGKRVKSYKQPIKSITKEDRTFQTWSSRPKDPISSIKFCASRYLDLVDECCWT